MTAVVEETQTSPAIPTTAPATLAAPWHLRAGALLVDIVPGLAVAATMALVLMTVPLRSVWWWVCAIVAGLVILLTLVNRLLLPTVIGWSLGRALAGIEVVRPDGTAVGPWRLLLRDLAHLLDTTSVLVGWLWPLWDQRRRTFADLLLRTEVWPVEQHAQPQRVRRLTARVVLGAALLSLGAAAMSCLAVYRHDQAVDRTRTQIAAQGPTMVVQMLSYDPKTVRDDFAHAQSLTTDKYRAQLIKQQEAVQKHPVLNQYWVTNSSVRSATPDRASMLLFMRGERGLPPEQRYITATVRVSFAKGADAQWRVDDLTVLTRPKPAGGGK